MKIELRNISPHCVREGDIIYDVFEDRFSRVSKVDPSNEWVKIYLDTIDGEDYSIEVFHTKQLSDNNIIYRERYWPYF